MVLNLANIKGVSLVSCMANLLYHFSIDSSSPGHAFAGRCASILSHSSRTLFFRRAMELDP